jgi:DNA-binding NarL/FixJ family response regulator
VPVASLTASLRIVIADDHPIWRSGLRADLAEGFDVVGEAADAVTAIELICALRPDVVLCDVRMPEGGGLAVVRACAGVAPIVMLTVSEDEADILDAVASGALGYLTKSTPANELRDGLRRVAKGEPAFSPALAALVLREFRRLAGARHDSNTLTDREREVLVLVGRGRTYGQIAEQLYISAKTVDNHVRNILAKLHLSRKAELIRYAADHHID